MPWQDGVWDWFFAPANPFTAQLIKSHQYLVTAPKYHGSTCCGRGLDSWVKTMRNLWRRNTSSVGIILSKNDCLGLRLSNQTGAFYIFAKIPAGYNQDSFAFLKILLRRRLLPLSLVLPLGVMEKVMFACLMRLAWRLSKKPWNDLRVREENHDSVYHESRLGAYNRNFREDDKARQDFYWAGLAKPCFR